MQLAEAGVPAWKFLADAIGKDIPTAMKMAEQGIKRKVVMLLIVIMAHWIDAGILGISTCRSMVIFAYLGNEGLSIIENLDRMGYGEYIPAFIREQLAQLRSEKKSLRKEP